MNANRGDRIVVESAHVGQPRREGEIVELLGNDGDVHYRVRWDDGHESIYFPSSDAHVVAEGGSAS